MKSYVKHSTPRLLTLGTILLGLAQGQSQILLKVDSTKTWLGYMNVFELPANGGGYLWGSPWGAADLTTFFTGTSTLTLMPNTNTYNPSDPYWVNPDGSGNKSLEANFYVENTALRGQTVTFDLTVLSNNLYGATDGHVAKAFVKTLDSGAGYTLVPGAYEFVDLTNSADPYTINITVTIPAGATMIPQYGFVTTGPDLNPAWAATNGLVRIKVDNSDPSIIGQPANRRVQVGDTATFTVTATGGSLLGYQWKRYNTNLLDGGNISGATNATLTIANAQLSDATVYTVTVTDAAGSLDSDPAVLRVKTAAEFANALDNPGFEDGVYSPWYAFAGSALKSTNDGYAYDPNFPVQTHDGTNCSMSYAASEWNGIFQDVPAAPGQIFTADGWFYVPTLEMFFNDIGAWLEVQFRTAGDAPLALYKSLVVTSSGTPLDTWMDLQATNGFAGDFVTPTTNAWYLVAPPGTAKIRYQVTVHALPGGFGSIYYDTMRLMKKIPVKVSSAVSAGDVTLSWLSQAATSYQVVYRDDLGDPAWTPLGSTIAGDGTVMSVSFPATAGKRFYAVLTL